MNRCPKCGAEYEGNFCPNGCNSAAYQQLVQPLKKKKLKGWQIALIILACVVGCAPIGIFMGQLGGDINLSSLPTNADYSQPATASADSEDRAAQEAAESAARAESEAAAQAAAESTARAESEAAALAEEQQKEDFINSCQSITFRDLARNPDSYKGQNFTFTGEVIQVLETPNLFSDFSSVTLRINVTQNEYGWWEDTILATVELPDSADRILEEDIITIYGVCQGQTQYETIFGSTVSLPEIEIKYYSISA